MKTTNRTFGKFLVLALVVLFALTAVVPVLAEPVAQDNLQVVIHNNEGLPAMTNDQFKVYQLFTGTPNKEGKIPEGDQSNADEWGAENWNNYTLADVEWGESIVGTKDGVKYDHSTDLLNKLKDESNDWAVADGKNVFADVKTAEELARVLETHKTNAFLQHFAKIVAELEGLEPIECKCEVHSDEKDHKNDYLTFTVPETGYYLFVEADKSESDEQDATSEYILAVLGDQEINLKASVPTVDKDIVDGNHGDKGDAAGVSDYVQFKLTGTLPKNFDDFDTYVYAFHDTLSKGLTLVGPDDAHPLTVTVYANQADADADKTLKGGTVVNENKGTDPAENNYTVTTKDLKDGCSLEVSFADLKTLKNNGEEVPVTRDSVFVVTYYAQVNEDAVIGSTGNPNTVQLEYSNDPNHDGTGRTHEKKVYVYAFGLDLNKVGDDEAHKEGLQGAGFVLKNAAGNYAIFKDQWILTVTTTTGEGESVQTTKEQSFYSTEEAANEAKTKAETDKAEGTTVTAVVSGPVRRLTGWTDDSEKPTTEDVTGLITAYENAKKEFDKATNEERAEDGSAYKALQEAKNALAKYLLESGANGKIPDVYGLDEGEYTLQEVITPDGYNTMDDFSFEIDSGIDSNTGELLYIMFKHDRVTRMFKVTEGNPDETAIFHSGLLPYTLVNQKAPFLPFTGGIGTLIFYVLGTALIVGAITYLVIATKKRKKAE